MTRAPLAVVAVCVLTTIHGACAYAPPTDGAANPTPAPPSGSPSAPQTAEANDGRQAVSLLGKPLFTPATTPARHGQLQANLDIAHRQLEASPHDEDAAIWYGRRLAYLGRFREAIAAYSNSIEEHPDSYRLLRHRGHRYLTCRQFDLAVTDLTRAWELARDKPDAPESDGDPRRGAGGEPRTTDKSNILYHLGLAYYLKGDFARAAEVFGRRSLLCAGGAKVNDDITVSFVNWQYLSLRRCGQDDAAARVLKEFRRTMDVRENQAYYALLRVYRNEVPADVLGPGADTELSTNLVMAYGVGVYKLLNGDKTGAREMFTRLTGSPLWPSFGVLASEAELARDRDQPTAAVGP